MVQNFDKFDIEMLEILQKDSTISIKDIAKKIGLSSTATFERIKHLETSGVIDKYVALVNRKKAGINVLVYCNITLKKQSKDALMAFEKAVSTVPEIIEVHSVSGTYDYMLKIAATDIDAYNSFVVDVISNISNIGQYHSCIVLSEVKKETAYKIS